MIIRLQGETGGCYFRFERRLPVEGGRERTEGCQREDPQEEQRDSPGSMGWVLLIVSPAIRREWQHLLMLWNCRYLSHIYPVPYSDVDGRKCKPCVIFCFLHLPLAVLPSLCTLNSISCIFPNVSYTHEQLQVTASLFYPNLSQIYFILSKYEILHNDFYLSLRGNK